MAILLKFASWNVLGMFKRMGTRLRRLKKENKGNKLSDGKMISGRGRLTDAVIDKLQTYYGLAIRRHVGSLDDMQKAVWATYFHMASTDAHPSHGLCPKAADTWCSFNKSEMNGEPYIHKNYLPAAVLEVLKPIYQQLAKPELLKKCLHGKTQNANESFNNVVWERAPKNVFLGLETLKIATMDAVLTFNDGSIARADIFRLFGVSPGFFTVQWLRDADRRRLYFASRATQLVTKEARKARRQAKKRNND
ncbi:unnamed protein product, partial [Ixodes pacificus]